MNKLLFALLLTCLFGQAYASALYKWVDEDGNVSYHDRPPPAGSEFVLQSTNLKYGDMEEDDEIEARENALKKFPVTLYVIQKCASCDLARNYLKKKNISFKEKDVGSDQKASDELVKLTGGKAVPTVRIGEQTVRGFEQGEINQKLSKAGYFGVPKEEEEDEAGEEGQDNNES